ncbi:MAG: pyridoxamine 5'-phosphate oxidase [Archangiaceae bacterium]|nr:pyridoxamine 5'-phosphate oxidase [Archangiaceae bacterium]
MHLPWHEPFDRFARLFARAEQAQPKDPNQMWLATVDARGRPQLRVVLLKGCDVRGFVFFTNYESQKARALEKHPYAALDFYWPALEEQVRVEGTATKVSAEESDAYFQTRPRASRIGAWASDQSRPCSSRLELEARVAKATLVHAVGHIPRPPHWGGYRVEPDRFEFWRAHPFRLHWREQYEKSKDAWVRSLLYP